MANSNLSQSTYHQTHDPSTTRSHAARTASIEAAFILSHLQPTHHILDIGCGPGSISTGLAKYVPHGTVTGADLSEEVLSQARELASSQSVTNITFEIGNVQEGLKYADASFDVVFCNQTITHIPDPVRAMKEMRRVCKPGGFVAARESDMPFRWYPYNEGLQLWDRFVYLRIFGPAEDIRDSEFPMNPPHSKGYRGGSLLHVYARLAGFEPGKMVKSASVQMHASEEQRRWWVESYVARLENEASRAKVKEAGATEGEIEKMIQGMKDWGEDVDGWMVILHGELVAWV